MKPRRLLALFVCALATTTYAQDATRLTEGQAFGRSISPTPPAGVVLINSQNTWYGGKDCYYSASVAYTCPTGQTLSGSTCISDSTTSTSATVSYSCPSGQSLSGSNCTQTVTTTSAATPSYSCPAGATLSGTTCTQSSSAAATPSYSCPAGSTLSGSNCISTNNVSTPATVASYSCPAGSTLSGSSCITVVTTPAKINYSCLDGSAPINGACIYKSAKTEWVNACGPLEAAAGTVLGAP